MYRFIFPAFAIVALLFVSGCTTSSGVAEFQVYNKTFSESAAVTSTIIDQLAASERLLEKKRRLKPNSVGIDSVFRPEDATIFSNQADPPLAAQYRQALAVVSQYNKIMLGFATGQGLAQLEADIFNLANEATVAVSVISGSAGLAGGLTPYLGALREIAKYVLANKSRAIFRERALLYHQDIVGILETMRDGSAEMFPNLTYSIKSDIIRAVRSGAPINKLQQKHRNVRILLSDWVVMMDKTILALNAVKIAIENPSLSIQLSGATERIIELRSTVDAVRKNLAFVNAQ